MITKDNIAQMGMAAQQAQQAQQGLETGKNRGGTGGAAPAHAPVWMGGMETGKGGGTAPTQAGGMPPAPGGGMQAGKGGNQSAMAASMQQQLNPRYAQMQSMGLPTPSMGQSAPPSAPPPAATSGLAPLPSAASQLRPRLAEPISKEQATQMMSGPVARAPELSTIPLPQPRQERERPQRRQQPRRAR